MQEVKYFAPYPVGYTIENNYVKILGHFKTNLGLCDQHIFKIIFHISFPSESQNEDVWQWRKST